MNKYAELFLSKKLELESIVATWWQIADVFTDFQGRIDELKEIVARCPQTLANDFAHQVNEIEEALRKICFIV